MKGKRKMRSVNEKENAERRREIIDAAQRLIYAKGYDSMSIQDLLDELKISKGAFYHYYASKQALLEAFVERLSEEGLRVVAPFADDPRLSAIQKFEAVMSVGMAWKSERKDMLISLMRSWYSDENLLVRHKANAVGQRLMAPLIERIVRQGVSEGVFDAPSPAHAAAMFMLLGYALSESIVSELLGPAPEADAFERVLAVAAAYSEIYERILGAPAGSIRLIDPDLMKRWLTG